MTMMMSKTTITRTGSWFLIPGTSSDIYLEGGRNLFYNTAPLKEVYR